MDVGFYLMIASAIVVFKIAEHDKRKAWLWAGSCFAVSLVIAQFIKAGIPAVFIGFFLTFVAMTITNNKSPDQRTL